MDFQGIVGGFYKIASWLFKLMYLHLLWIGFTLLGLGVLGVGPATGSLIYVLYKFFDEGDDIPIFKHFVSFYKAHFWRMNGLGWLVIGVGLFLYMDLRISELFIGIPFLHLILLFISLIFLIVSLYLFIVFARYRLPFFHYLRQTFFIAIARPLESIGMLFSLFLLVILYAYLPILILFMGSSLSVYPIVLLGYRACVKAEDKKMNAEKSRR